MAVQVSDIIGAEGVGHLLNDTGATNYTLAQRYNAFLQGQRSIAMLQPKATATHAAVQCAAGAKQSGPATCIQVLDVTHNLGVGGSTAGKAITVIDREDLALIDPDWMVLPDDDEVAVSHYAVDDRDPTVFWVYPAQPATAGNRQYVNVLHSAYPSAITLGGDGSVEAHYDVNISLADVWQTALVQFVMGFLLLRDNHTVNGAQRATQHINLFLALIDRRDMIQTKYSPNMPFMGGQGA